MLLIIILFLFFKNIVLCSLDLYAVLECFHDMIFFFF